MIMEIATGHCYGCGCPFTFCPDCVVTIAVDPMANRAPDVDAEGRTQPPDPAAVARSVQRPVCPECVERANERRAPGETIEPESDRHARHVGVYGTSGGVGLTNAVIEQLAEDAETGYDVARFRPRRG